MTTFGSVCSGIEAAQLAFSHFGYRQMWSSEIAEFPTKVLAHHHPTIPNLGDMTLLTDLILQKKIEAPELLCGGTPCQAFSLAGWKNGLNDERGQLTITFIEIANAIDKVRFSEGKNSSVILWENVEGVLNEKTNAFGNFIAGLAGFDNEISISKWSKAGYIEGPTRNIAWRVLDAKYFGLPQQRKRLYVLAGGKDFRPDSILFEFGNKNVSADTKKSKIDKSNVGLFSDLTSESINKNIFVKDGSKFEVFREYTDCLYAAYGTKWNGNAAAYNGSLFVAQNERLRRLTPIECERLMGIPDNYTLLKGCSHTNRYQAVGNSWAVPVVKWIGSQLESKGNTQIDWKKNISISPNNLSAKLYLLGDVSMISPSLYLNTSAIPNNKKTGSMYDVVEANDISEKFYLSPQACAGILRRTRENDMRLNSRLEEILIENSKDFVFTTTSGRPRISEAV